MDFCYNDIEKKRCIMEEFDLKEFLLYLLKQIWIVLLVVFVFFILGNFYSLVIKDSLYRSETTLVLAKDAQEDSEGITSSDVQLNQNLAATYSEIIKSRKVLSQAIEHLKLDYSIESLRSNIEVTAVTNTSIIKISIVDSNGERASNIANEIAKIFADEIKSLYNLQNVTVLDEAVLATSPFNKNIVKENILYVVAGIFVGASILFVFFYFDTTIKSKEMIENKLGLVVLGVIPLVRKE